MVFSPSSRRLRTQCGQAAQPREVVGRHRQGQQLVDLLQALHHDLEDRADRLAPAEALLDPLSFALADDVAGVSRRAAIDRAASGALGVLRNMWRDVHRAARLDEAARFVALVGAEQRRAPCGARFRWRRMRRGSGAAGSAPCRRHPPGSRMPRAPACNPVRPTGRRLPDEGSRFSRRRGRLARTVRLRLATAAAQA